jgi:Uma2 family endonuclease
MMSQVTLNLSSIVALNEERFFALCLDNRDVRLELTEKAELVVLPPTDGLAGMRNAELTANLVIWNRTKGKGFAVGSSTGFRLPNGAVRSPDAAWVKQERLNALDYDPEKFLPLAPDFVVELRSASDYLIDVQNKMKEYMDNGVRLGWLLNPQDNTVEVYRTGNEIEVLRSPTSLSGEDVLLGFVLDLAEILN